METICKFSIKSKILYNVLKRLQSNPNNILYLSKDGLLFSSHNSSTALYTDVLKDYVYNNTIYLCYNINTKSVYTYLSRKDDVSINVSIYMEGDTHTLSFESENIKHNVMLLIYNESEHTTNSRDVIWITDPKTTIVVHEVKLLNKLIKQRHFLHISTIDSKIHIGGISDYVLLDNEHRGDSINVELSSMKFLKKVFPIYSEYCIFNFDIENQKVDIVFIEYKVVYKHKMNCYVNQSITPA